MLAVQVDRVQTDVDQDFGTVVRLKPVSVASLVSNGNSTGNWSVDIAVIRNDGCPVTHELLGEDFVIYG